MARVLALGLCSPGLLSSLAINDASPACPCGGTGRSLSARRGTCAASVFSLGALNGLAPSTPNGLGVDPRGPSPGLRASVCGAALAPLLAGATLVACFQQRNTWAQRKLATFSMSLRCLRTRSMLL